MTNRKLYIYAEPREGFPDQHYNMTALTVDGKIVDTSAGLNTERISSMVGSVLGNNTQIRLNEHPEGKELTTILDATLDIHLNSLIEVNQNVR
ncbi:MAG TPA: hypothetical protein VJH92_05650 [Candidatus Nanoarchaeia archaeon]|nr:hypothetical protein [Candidatus Nanoarchaeia archaeon]